MNPQPTTNLMEHEHASPLHSEPSARAPGRRFLKPAIVAGALLALAAIGFVCRESVGSLFVPPTYKATPPRDEPVSVLSKDLVAVASGTPLEKRLQIVQVAREDLEYPVLNVTGSVMARLAPGTDLAESRWDFAIPEVASAYSDWLNASADVPVFETAAGKTRELVKVRVEFLKKEWERKEANRNVLPERDVIAAKSDYLQADIQGQKDINDADSVLKKAIRNRGLLERQLFQAGVDPVVVSKGTQDLILVVAEVPEAKVMLVTVGQPCEARFFGDPTKVYKGKVGRIGPSVSKEKRTLRVTFEMVDPTRRLLPGMFADIGLGTESRRVLTIPTDAVLHAGQFDYVLKEESHGKYRAVPVKVEEPRQVASGNAAPEGVSRIPVIEGLREGDRVVSTGSILLKPVMVKALASNGAPTN